MQILSDHLRQNEFDRFKIKNLFKKIYNIFALYMRTYLVLIED